MIEEDKYLYPSEPSIFSKRDINQFLSYCFDLGVSDITLKTNDYAVCDLHGKKIRVTKRRLSKTEIIGFITDIGGGESVLSHLNSGEQHDCSYSIKETRHKTIRFRVNIVGILDEDHTGYEMTMRTIIGTPVDIKTLNLPQEVLDAISPKNGMVLVTGATGSGKSTLLSSVIRSLLEQPEGNRKILTYEAPIEFVYHEVKRYSNIISQSEIPKNLPNFAEATKNALRRAPQVILIGEMRDKETIREGVIAANTGHLFYSTLHSNGVAPTIKRMVALFPEDEKNSATVEILSNLRLIISQMLVPGVDGKRVALREYLIFNEKIIDDLINAGDKVNIVCAKILKEKGTSFADDALAKFSQGLISESEYNRIIALSK